MPVSITRRELGLGAAASLAAAAMSGFAPLACAAEPVNLAAFTTLSRELTGAADLDRGIAAKLLDGLIATGRGAELAALVAGAWIILPGASNAVVASAPLTSGKGDRLDYRPLGSQCSEQAWPYFEHGCLRDQRAVKGQARTVRLVVPGRPAAKITLAAR